MSVGQATRIEIALTQHAVGRLKAKYSAWSGLVFGVQQIQLDSLDPESNQEDTLLFCGIRKDKENLSEESHQKTMGDGFFSYTLEDEERRLNVNALTFENVNMAVSLLETLGVEQNTAQTIAFSLIDWKDADDVLSDPLYGAEDEYYLGLDETLKCKNASLDSLEELLLVKGMTPEILKTIRPYVTIFPKQGFLTVNINTASKEVLRAVAGSVKGSLTNTTEEDADSLVDKMLEYRNEEDFEGHREDWFSQFQQQLNPKEQAIFLTLNRYWTFKSNYFDIKSQGIAGARKVRVDLEAMIDRTNFSIVALKMR